MVVMPKLLYPLWHSPVWVPKAKFDDINKKLRRFIWGKSRHRLGLSTLMRPMGEGGLSLPNMYNYFLAAQLTHLLTPLQLHYHPPLHRLWGAVATSTSFPWNVIFGTKEGLKNVICCVQVRALQKVNELLNIVNIDPRTPLWGNPQFQYLSHVTPPPCWTTKGITSIADVWEADTLLPFAELRRRYGLPCGQWLVYQQMGSALCRQSRNKPICLETSPLLEMLLQPHQKGTLSKIYRKIMSAHVKATPIRSCDAWDNDFHLLTDDQWGEALKAPRYVSYNYNDRCKAPQATLLHTMWECTGLAAYWEGVLKHLSLVLGVVLPADPALCLLGIGIKVLVSPMYRQLISRALFHARRQITMQWKERIILTRQGQLTGKWPSWQKWQDTPLNCD
ncbi:hypothetical protein XELAEV_18012177mg [Xenopus laevis]|uniref:Reverse transcriptase n=1 Tax=Xenopus laevis TaxID=8355 RepID=A0A974HY12_XENLA|nr:hypothetical protein XELAEV_18012177mg [Xenopus laevis]